MLRLQVLRVVRLIDNPWFPKMKNTSFKILSLILSWIFFECLSVKEGCRTSALDLKFQYLFAKNNFQVCMKDCNLCDQNNTNYFCKPKGAYGIRQKVVDLHVTSELCVLAYLILPKI